MYKILINIIIFHSLLFSAYNPFFKEINSPEKPIKKEIKPVKIIVKEKRRFKPKVSKIPKKTNIKLQYFGFLETNKGKFALINFNSKTIVIKQRDRLYVGNEIYKIKKIHSNYLLIEDSYRRVQSVYFSSNIER